MSEEDRYVDMIYIIIKSSLLKAHHTLITRDIHKLFNLPPLNGLQIDISLTRKYVSCQNRIVLYQDTRIA